MLFHSRTKGVINGLRKFNNNCKKWFDNFGAAETIQKKNGKKTHVLRGALDSKMNFFLLEMRVFKAIEQYKELHSIERRSFPVNSDMILCVPSMVILD